MLSLKVGKTFWGETLKADCLSTGITLQFEYESGKHFPADSLHLNWKQWERFVAWVELQRKEQALKDGETK